MWGNETGVRGKKGHVGPSVGRQGRLPGSCSDPQAARDSLHFRGGGLVQGKLHLAKLSRAFRAFPRGPIGSGLRPPPPHPNLTLRPRAMPGVPTLCLPAWCSRCLEYLLSPSPLMSAHPFPQDQLQFRLLYKAFPEPEPSRAGPLSSVSLEEFVSYHGYNPTKLPYRYLLPDLIPPPRPTPHTDCKPHRGPGSHFILFFLVPSVVLSKTYMEF